MWGSIFGDIVGSRFEHSPIKSSRFTLFGQGCECTDDTILAVATAHAILHGCDFRTAYQDFFHCHPRVAYGARFVSWASRRDHEPYNSCGNGSAMRAGPIGWAVNNLHDVLALASESAMVSHSHPEGIAGAQASAGCVFLARSGATKPEITSFMREAIGYELPASLDLIRPSYSFDASCAGTVPPAVQAFIESHDVESAIRLAVSLGGDSDTLACIAGSIAEAHYGGVPAIARKQISSHFLPDDLLPIVREFCSTFGVPEPP